MQVVRAKTAGFCMGVSLAVRRLNEALAQTPATGNTRLATLGPIIHNPRLIRSYEEKGVVCLSSPNEVKEGDTVLIRAHGVPYEEEKSLAAKGVRLIDATCPKVKKAQLAIAAMWEHDGMADGSLLLYGEAEHPEVRGLVSYARGNAHVFLNVDEFDAVPLAPKRAYFLAAQTTQDIAGFEAVRVRVEQRLGYAVPVLHTICDATRKRQEEVLAIAGKVDVVVVVGGKNSGNTKRLAEVAEKAGTRAILVEDVAELTASMFSGVAAVGLTAGASTPVGQVNAVEAWLLQAYGEGRKSIL